MSLELRYIELKSGYADEYLELIGKTELDESKFILEDIQDRFPVERIHQLLNDPNSDIPLHQIF